MYVINIQLHQFEISILKKKSNTYIYVYNKTYFFFLKFSKTTKVSLQGLKTINIKCDFLFEENFLKRFIRQFYLCDGIKIKFTGKGYKIKKNSKQSLILLFNRAHITILWWNNLIIKKLKKYKLYIKCTNINKPILQKIIDLRSINIFTKKGWRQSRKIL